MGVVIYSAELAFKDIPKWTEVQRLVMLWITKSFIRRMVPWKYHIEYANEGPFP